jgi:hypothetical protein
MTPGVGLVAALMQCRREDTLAHHQIDDIIRFLDQSRKPTGKFACPAKLAAKLLVVVLTPQRPKRSNSEIAAFLALQTEPAAPHENPKITDE